MKMKLKKIRTAIAPQCIRGNQRKRIHSKVYKRKELNRKHDRLHRLYQEALGKDKTSWDKQLSRVEKREYSKRKCKSRFKIKIEKMESLKPEKRKGRARRT